MTAVVLPDGNTWIGGAASLVASELATSDADWSVNEQVGFELTQAQSPETTTGWRCAGGTQSIVWDAGDGATAAVNAVALAGASFAAASIAVDYKAATGDTWIRAVESNTLAAGHTIRLFASGAVVEARWWRVVLTDTAASEGCAVLWLGEMKRPQHGLSSPFSPPSVSTAFNRAGRQTRGGQALPPSSFQVGALTTISIQQLRLSDYKIDLEQLRVRLASGLPLWLLWDAAQAADEAAYVVAAAEVRPPALRQRHYVDIAWPVLYVPPVAP